MLSELSRPAGSRPEKPLFERLIESAGGVDAALEGVPEVLLGEEEERLRAAFDHLARWGGMPGLLELGEADRRTWLSSYQQSYLERDLTDLVQLRDLHPFRTLQQLAMLRSGQILSYSELGRDAGIAAATARRYLEYLDISYQVVILRPYYRNLTSSLVKTPKLYWVDLGLLREGTGQWGPLDGALFETLVVVEAHKWIQTTAADARLYFYRTRSQREVDLLVETSHGLMAIEIKNREQTAPSDARSMIALAEATGDRWLGGLVVHRGRAIQPLRPEHSIWSMPVHRLFG